MLTKLADPICSYASAPLTILFRPTIMFSCLGCPPPASPGTLVIVSGADATVRQQCDPSAILQ